MTIKRFDPMSGYIAECADGDYVLYDDYAAALATLAAKLRAGDALADAVHDCVNRNGKTIDLIAALAAYKQAGMGGESSP